MPCDVVVVTTMVKKKTQPFRGQTDESTSDEYDSDDASSDGDILPGDVAAAAAIIKLKKELKEEKRLRAAEKKEHKSATGKQEKSYKALQEKCDASQRSMIELTRRYEAEHFTLALKDKEVKALNAAEKKIQKDNKAEIAKLRKDHKAEIGSKDEEIKKLDDDGIKPMRKELKELNDDIEAARKEEKIARKRLSKLRFDSADNFNAVKKHDGQMKKMAAELEAATKKVDGQLNKKLENAREVEQLKLEQETEKIKKFELAKEASRQKIVDEFAMKTQLAKYTTSLRSGEKKKVEKRKHKKKTEEISIEAQRMESARKSMKNTTCNNGGAFPNPANTTIEEVSCRAIFLCCLNQH